MHALTVFARPPIAGRVKSRLSPALPAPLAARLYEALLADTLAAAGACAADSRAIAWSESAGAPEAPSGFAAFAQVAGDLGARLAAAFAAAFDAALATPGTRAVIAGSDCPAMRAETLDAAFAALATHDAVIAPAADGGYALLGLARPAPALFRDVPWSSERVLAVTLDRAREAGLRVATLATLADLDTPADLAVLVGALAGGDARACGAATRAALAAMGLVPRNAIAPRGCAGR